MTRKCELTGKTMTYGHNVSHSNRKTKRRFLPNLKIFSLKSQVLGKTMKLRLATSTARTIDLYGLDEWLLATSSLKLSIYGLSLKKMIKKTQANQAIQKEAEVK